MEFGCWGSARTLHNGCGLPVMGTCSAHNMHSSSMCVHVANTCVASCAVCPHTLTRSLTCAWVLQGRLPGSAGEHGDPPGVLRNRASRVSQGCWVCSYCLGLCFLFSVTLVLFCLPACFSLLHTMPHYTKHGSVSHILPPPPLSLSPSFFLSVCGMSAAAWGRPSRASGRASVKAGPQGQVTHGCLCPCVPSHASAAASALRLVCVCVCVSGP